MGEDPLQQFSDRMADLQNPQLIFLASMEGLYDGINDQVQDLINGTITWEQALRNVAGTIVSAVITSFAQMAAAAVTGYLAAQIGIQGLAAAGLASTVAMGAASTAAWVPAAMAASIATVGAAAGVGAASFAAAMLSGAAVSSLAAGMAGFGMAALGGAGSAAGGPGFAAGGKVYGPYGHDAVRARLTAGEFVIKKSAVDKYGPDFLGQINDMAAPTVSMPSFANAGAAAAGGSAGRGKQVKVAIVDDRRMLNQIRRDPDWDDAIVSTMRRYRSELL
jgi:hypothetical protein